MELKDFVAATLTGIIEGIVEAQGRVQKLDGHINPGGLMRNQSAVSDDALWDNRHNNYARTVSFDVAVTIEEGTATSAKVGVVAGLFNLGADGASSNKQLAVSRVQFAVPVLFPVSELPKEARMGRRPESP